MAARLGMKGHILPKADKERTHPTDAVNRIAKVSNRKIFPQAR